MAKIYQRTKKDIVKASTSLNSISNDIKLKIEAHTQTWWDLLDLYFDPKGPSSISDAFYEFYEEVLREVIEFLDRKRTRGTHAQSGEFTHRMKRYCAYVYCISEYWLKKPRGTWPDPIKEAVRWLETPTHKRPEEIQRIAGELDLISIHTQRIKRPTAPMLTAVFAEQYSCRERPAHYGLYRINFPAFIPACAMCSGVGGNT